MRTLFVLAISLLTIPAFAGGQGQGQGKGQGQSPGYGQNYGSSETHATCREGSEETFLEDTGSGDSMQPIRYVCRGGRFVKLFKDARDYGPRSPGIYSCREGSEETFLEDTGSGDSMQPIRYVCRGGRFVKLFKDARDYGPRSPGIYSCREGSHETFLENNDSSGEGMTPVQYVCQGGRFVRL